MANAPSAISSVAPGPAMWTPRIAPDSLSAMILARPEVSPGNQRFSICRQWERSDFIVQPLMQRLLFCQTHAAQFGTGVDTRRNRLKVDIAFYPMIFSTALIPSAEAT